MFVALVLVLSLSRTKPKPLAAAKAERTEPAVAEAPPEQTREPAQPEPPRPRVLPPLSKEAADAERRAFNQRKAEMAQNALNDTNNWLKYPLWSSPLSENMQYKPPVPFHTRAAGPGDAFPVLEVYPSKMNYKPGEPIQIIAIAHGPNGKIAFDALTAKTHGAIRERPDMDLRFEEKPDLTYVATLSLTPEQARKYRGEWGVLVDCEISAQHRVGATQFQVMTTDATIAGPYRATLENGSLSVEVGIDATVEGTFQHLKGELWGPKDEPIAYAWVRNDKTPLGASTMKLVFYGKTIRDSGVDGPYRVKNLILTTFDSNNDRIENPVVDPNLVTEAYKRDAFTDKSINDGHAVLEEKKKILEDELRRAQKNEFDPHAPSLPIAPRVPKSTPPPQ